MTQLFLGCSKCGQPVPVEQEMVLNAVALTGNPPPVAHSMCPGEEAPVNGERPVLRRFAITVAVAEVWPDGDEAYPALEVTEQDVKWKDPTLGGMPLELLMRMQHTVEATNFPTAMNGPLSGWLEDTWIKARDAAVLADLPAAPPA